ncbi:MAG TPA: ornithine cyclodeaminase family protein [Candidatus Binataceae bacterium]|nr:ornithine cyclodeaminase family protein [Candidatus Binataceae bacterium]
MLILTNDMIEPLLHMPDCVAALEAMYRDFGLGEAADIPRHDALVANSRPGAVHGFKTMSGSWPRAGVTALRLNSDIVTWPERNGSRRRVKVPLSEPGGRYNGSVLLFSTETGQLLAILNDGVMQKTRVGGSSGVAAKHLARADSRTMGLLGTGWQAEAQLEAIAAVRPLVLVKVFSPTRENRERFVARFRARLQLDIRAVDDPGAAAEGADILISATNSMMPTILPEWLRPGIHISSVRGSEIPLEALAKAQCLVVNTKSPVEAHPAKGWPSEVPEFTNGDYGRPDIGPIDYARVPELKDIVAGTAPGRRSDADITCFHNYKGLGLQFAALGHIVYRAAKERGLGLAIDDAYFTQTVHP